MNKTEFVYLIYLLKVKFNSQSILYIVIISKIELELAQ